MPTSGFDPLAALQAADAAAGSHVSAGTVASSARASSSPAEAIMNVQATGAYGGATRLYDRMKTLPTSTQAAAWAAMGPATRDMLHGLGYQVPNLTARSHIGAGGVFGDIWSGIASGYHDVASATSRGFNDTLNALGAPLRAVQHVLRASHEISEEGLAQEHGWTWVRQRAKGGGVTMTPGAFKDIFSPSAWAQAWRATTTGAQTLDPAIARSLVAEYGRSQVNLAVRVAHAGQQAVVASAPQKTRAQLVQMLADPRMQRLVQAVTQARMSVGRELVGTKFLAAHPAAGKYISGGLDAAFDLAATPLNAVGKAVKAARLARYGVREETVGRYLASDAGRADWVLSRPSVSRWADHVGSFLERGDYAGLGRFDPRLDSIASQLQSEGIDSTSKFRDWFAGQGGLAAILSGQVARPSAGLAIVPHLSAAGWAKASVKEALTRGLDRLADGQIDGLDKVALDAGDLGGTEGGAPPDLEALLAHGDLSALHGRIRGVSDIARVVRRLSTFIQTKPYLDIGPEADVANLRRFLQGFLPARRVDDVLNVFMGGDEGQRYRIVAAARSQMLHAMGLYDTAAGAAAGDKLIGALSDLERNQAYSTGGLDILNDGSEDGMHAAVLENQLSHRIAIPLPNQVRRMVREQTLLGKLGVNPVTIADRFMYLWRSLILDRPGFAVRFAITENLGRLLRTGPRKFLGSYLANGAAYTISDADAAAAADRAIEVGEIDPADREAEIAAVKARSLKPLLPYHPVERILAMLGERVPEGIRDQVIEPAQYYGAVLGATTRKWARAAERGGLKVLGLSTYIDAATHLYAHQPVSDAFNDVLSATHGVTGYIWTPEGTLRHVRDDAEAAVATFRQSSHYSEAAKNDPLWRIKWQFALDQLAHSKLGRAVLETIDSTERTQERAVLRVLNDPEFATEKARFARAERLPDGRQVGVDATQADADKAFARVVRKHVNTLVRSGHPTQGPVIHALVDDMLETGRGPSEDLLDMIDNRDLPASVFGPDILAVHGKDALFHRSFEALVGKPANWLTRQPHFIQAYAEALKGARELARATGAEGENAEQLASDVATKRAIEAVLPYIHNPQLRTQFEDTHRILFPFLFAQRQFLQRWGRTFADSPDAIRKIQLTMHGLRTAGFVRKDPTNGETFFYYPGSQYPLQAIQWSLTKIGVKVSQPLVVPFTGAVQYLMPGLSNPVTPSVGPFAAVSMKEMSKLFPELNGFDQKALGQGATTPTWQQFTPTIFNRLWNALTPADAGTELASSAMQAIKYLDATGHGLPANATPAQVTQYSARVVNWARYLLVVRAAMGFVLPATPKATLDPSGLDKRMMQLMNELPYTQAIAEFVREHPDATAYTQFSSETATEGFTPSTRGTLDWLNAHQSFAKAHPLAAAWFVPRTTGEYTPAAYREQIALTMRHVKQVTNPLDASTPGFLTDVINAKAANEYYGVLDRYEKLYTATTSSAEHQQLTHVYDTWKAAFFKQYPLFALHELSGPGQVKTARTLDDVSAALATADLPDSPMVAPMRTVMETYRRFVSAYTATVGMYSTARTHERKELKQAMETWLTGYAHEHPVIADFVNTLVRPSVETQK